jgi:replication factor C small subunit
MLWIEKYRPEDFSEILGQDHIVRHLASFAERRNVPHMLLIGPHGTGKSISVECLARQLYGDYWEENTTVFDTAALFGQGKSYLENEERFFHLYEKGASLIKNFKYIVKWYASIRPLDAEFKLMVFDNAGALTFEAQQAMRRIMEHFSATCRFVFCAQTMSGIIPAISSRCLPMYFSPVEPAVVLEYLYRILDLEGIASDRIAADDMELIVQASRGDMRKAIMLLELAIKSGMKADVTELSQSETMALTDTLFSALMDGDLDSANNLAATLMFNYGLNGREILGELKQAARARYNAAPITMAIADADFMLRDANTEILQIEALLARIITEVFSEKTLP